MLFQACLFLLAPRFLGNLAGALLRIQASDLDAFAVEIGAFFLGVLRRNAVAVMDDSLLVDPAVDGFIVLS